MFPGSDAQPEGALRAFTTWRGFWIGLVLVTLPLVVAICTVEVLPLLDYAANLGQASEVSQALFGSDPLGDLRFGPQPWPHSFLPLLWGALARLIGADPAGRLIISLILILLPISVAYYARGLGRSPWPALASGPLLCGPVLMVGLLNFLISLPLLFFGLGLVLRHSGNRRLLIAVAVGLGLFSMHLLSMATFIVVAPVVLLTTRPAPRLPVMAQFIAGLFVCCLATVLPWLARAGLETASVDEPRYRWFTIANPPHKISENHLGNLIDGQLLTPGYHWLVVGLAGLLIAGAVLGPALRGPRRLQLLLPPLIILCAAAVLPDFIGTTGMISSRLVTPFILLCLLLFQLPARGSRTQGIYLTLFASLLVGFGALFAWHLVRSQQQYRALHPHLAAVPRGSKLLVLPRTPRQACFDPGFHHHVGGHFRARRDVITNLEFPSIATSWLRYRWSSPRLGVSEEKCNAWHRLDRTVDLLEQRISNWFDFALTPNTERPRRRGAFSPVLATTDFVLFTRGSAARIELPAVSRHCSTARGEIARCSHRLRWSDARSSCRRWGGVLAMDLEQTRRGGASPPWIGLRFDPHAGRWQAVDGIAASPPAPRFDCLITDGFPGFLRVPCGTRALPVCRRRRGGRTGVEWDVEPRGRWELLLGRRLMTHPEARIACRKRHGALVSPPDDLRFIHRLAGQRDRVKGPLWIGASRQGSLTSEGQHEPGDVRSAPVCLLADGTVDLCRALHPFVCLASGEGG